MTDFGDLCLRILLSSGYFRTYHITIVHRSLLIVDARLEGVLLSEWVIACKE